MYASVKKEDPEYSMEITYKKQKIGKVVKSDQCDSVTDQFFIYKYKK